MSDPSLRVLVVCPAAVAPDALVDSVRAPHITVTAADVPDARRALASDHLDVVVVLLDGTSADVLTSLHPADAATAPALVAITPGEALPVVIAGSVPLFACLHGPLPEGELREVIEAAGEQRRGRVRQQTASAQHAELHSVIRRGKQEWEQTFDAIADPIGVFDARGTLLRGNRALATHLGCDVRALAGRSCREVGFCGFGCPACWVCRGISEPIHSQVSTADGQVFHVTTFPMVGDGQAATVQVAKNVTAEIASARRLQAMSDELAAANQRSRHALAQLQETQAQLLQIEKLSAIGELVAGLAHELNNPLTSVIGYAQLLLDDLAPGPSPVADPESVRQDLTRIAEESERAARIVRNLLAFARRQPAARALHEVPEIVEQTLALRDYALRTAGIALEKRLDPAMPRILVDPAQLQQALLNLLLNAEQAMRDRPVKCLRVELRYREEAAAIELRVADTGHGIPPAILGRIFDPFFTTRDVGEGTGLGLSSCYGIVRDHGGDISVESREGEGTTFTILLPARLTPAPGRRALVVHPKSEEGAIVHATLDAWGYVVTVAGSAESGLAHYQGAPFDALLLDRRIVLDHEEAWRRARLADGRGTPLIVFAESDEAGAAAFAAIQPVMILPVPLQLPALHSAMRIALEEPL